MNGRAIQIRSTGTFQAKLACVNLRSITIAGIAIAVGLWIRSSGEIQHPPGIIAAEEPVQTPVDPSLEPWERDGYRFTPLAGFSLRARLLGSERYRLDDGAAVSPVDFALGWGRMSDSAVLEPLSISQHGRFYHYRWRNKPPIPSHEISRSSANMHLVPSTDAVKRTLLKARVGQLVTLTGQLIRIDGPDGWKWKSSLTRTDTGGGACELVWVEDVELDDE